jgi:hypothetical protein
MAYTYARKLFVQDAESLDGIPKKLLIHRRTGGIFLDMCTIFDVMWEVRQRVGHLGHDKTHDACKETYYSPTHALVEVFL